MGSPFESGQTVGRYRILRPLGSGAMGVVYLAEDPQIERLLAIKTVRLVPDETSELAERSERLLREAKTAGRLIHPHIVTLFDAGEHQGTLYLAFEYVEGSNLADRIHDGAPLSLAEALRLTGEAAAGLTFAHRRGIVHRDVKPANLLLTADGRIKISDFGIAKVLGEATELTMTGTVVGSPHYLSPEQVRGEPLDGRSDLFSLGVVLYELLGARRPFDGDTLTTLLYQILHQEPPPMPLRPGVPPALVEVMSRLLAKDRNDRYADGDELIGALAALELALPSEVLAAPAVVIGSEGQVEPTRLLAMTGAHLVAPATRPAEVPGEPPATRVPAVPPPPPGAAPGSGSVAPMAPAPPASSRRAWLAVAAVLAVLTVLGGVAAVAGYLWWRGGGGEQVARLVAGEPEAGTEVAVQDGETAEEANPPLPGPLVPPAVEPAAATAGELKPGPAVPAEGRALTRGGSAEVPAASASSEPDGTAPRPASVPPPRPEPAAPVQPPAADPEQSPAGAADEPAASGEPEPRALPPGAARRLERALERRPELREVVEDAVERAAPDQELDTGLALVFDVRPAEAFALLDGTVVGRVREHGAGNPYVLPGPGEYLLKLRSAGMEDHRILVRASASGAARTTVSATLSAAAAADLALGDLPVVRVQNAVAFEVHPATAEVEVDGRRVGRADQYPGRFARPATWLRLPPGRHRLSLVAPGYERRDFAVDVSAGAQEERRRIEVRLEPSEGRS